MDLASRIIWRFGCPMCVRHMQFFCQITKCSFNFCHLTEKNFIIISLAVFGFCQIIKGSPLNNNVPEGLSVTSGTCDRRRSAHTDWAIYLEFSVAGFIILWNLFWVIKNLPLEPIISWLLDGSRTEKKLDHEKTTDKPILGWKSMVLIVLCIWFWSFD